MTEINNLQKSLIHIGIAELGIPDELYRDMLLERFKVDTCMKLQYEQASAFISELVRKGFRIHKRKMGGWGIRDLGKSKKIRKYEGTEIGRKIKNQVKALSPQSPNSPRPNLIYLPTPGQLNMIEHLRQDIRWKYHDGYQRFVFKMLGRTFLKTKGEAQKLIESLKGMRKSQERGYPMGNAECGVRNAERVPPIVPFQGQGWRDGPDGFDRTGMRNESDSEKNRNRGGIENEN